jgi:hypothetical protein
MTNAPSHEPRHHLQDVLYYVLHDYRTAKRIGLRTGEHRRKCLAIIRMIKGKV